MTADTDDRGVIYFVKVKGLRSKVKGLAEG